MQDPELLRRARKLRGHMSPFEARLWSRISKSQLGYKFRRQHVIEHCIVDFFCPEKALIVEVDGDTHRSEKDRLRDRRNLKLGFKTIRFSNGDVGANIKGVLERLISELNALPDRWPHPYPSPKGDGKQ